MWLSMGPQEVANSRLQLSNSNCHSTSTVMMNLISRFSSFSDDVRVLCKPLLCCVVFCAIPLVIDSLSLWLLLLLAIIIIIIIETQIKVPTVLFYIGTFCLDLLKLCLLCLSSMVANRQSVVWYGVVWCGIVFCSMLCAVVVVVVVQTSGHIQPFRWHLRNCAIVHKSMVACRTAGQAFLFTCMCVCLFNCLSMSIRCLSNTVRYTAIAINLSLLYGRMTTHKLAVLYTRLCLS